MKIKILCYFFIGIIWTSCSHRYQVHEVASNQVQEIEEDVYLYESEDIAITYDFWAEGGYLLFEVYNERDSTLYLDLKKSQFSVNGTRFSYTQNIPQNRNSVLKIEGQDSQTIEGFPVTYEWSRMPQKQAISQFGEADSPLIIENKLVYAFNEDLKNEKEQKNKFWVESISQLKKREFKDYQAIENSKSDKFYVSKYSNADESIFWLEVVLDILEIMLLF